MKEDKKMQTEGKHNKKRRAGRKAKSPEVSKKATNWDESIKEYDKTILESENNPEIKTAEVSQLNAYRPDNKNRVRTSGLWSSELSLLKNIIKDQRQLVRRLNEFLEKNEITGKIEPKQTIWACIKGIFWGK